MGTGPDCCQTKELYLTSRMRDAPAFSMALGSSMARAIVTPSLMTLGAPNSSSTTLRPEPTLPHSLGPGNSCTAQKTKRERDMLHIERIVDKRKLSIEYVCLPRGPSVTPTASANLSIPA